jgi:hypothetical protein
MSVRTFFGALLTRRTWAELLFALVSLPLGVAGFTYTVTTFSFSAGLLVTFVGLPLLAITGLGARWFGYGMRVLANSLAGAAVPPPPPFRSHPGLLGWIGACLQDGAAWRARLYLVLKLPVGILNFVTGVTFFSYGIGGLTYSMWQPLLPCDRNPDGVCHRGVEITDNYFLDTPFRVALATVVGAILLLLAPCSPSTGCSCAGCLGRPAPRSASGNSSRPGRKPWTIRPRRCAASSATCTTEPRRASSRWP